MNVFRIAVSILLLLVSGAGSAANPLDPSQAVDVAGSQRMLSQQIVKAYCQIGLNEFFGEPDVQLKKGVELFENNMADLAPYISEGEAAAAAAEVRQQWGEYKSLATSTPSVANARKLYDASERLLAAAQKQVDAIQASTGVKTGNLVNMAGRQRMLSQRMAMLHMLKIWGISDESSEQQSAQAHKEFVTAHGRLLKEPRNSPEITKSLTSVGNALKLLDYSLKSKEGLSYTVASTTDKMLAAMNEVTRAYSLLDAPAQK